MGTSYEAVVLSADQAALLQQLETLPREFAPISFEAFRVVDKGFVVFGWPEGIRHLGATDQIQDLASMLSQEFGKAVAVHSDEMLQVREATLFQAGESVRSFGDWDELWAPMDAKGEEVPNALRCRGVEIPDGEVYAFVWDGIDAGLDAAGFRDWFPVGGLIHLSPRGLCN